MNNTELRTAVEGIILNNSSKDAIFEGDTFKDLGCDSLDVWSIVTEIHSIGMGAELDHDRFNVTANVKETVDYVVGLINADA